MNPFDLILNLVLGLILGTLGGLFGIGGGLIAIPALGILFGLDQQLAQGTALVMVVPNVVLALWRYHQRNRIDPRHALLLGASSFACAWLASLYAVGLDVSTMRWAFVVFLLVLAAYNLARLRLAPTTGAGGLRHHWGWFAPLGGVSGALGGLFGVGGAVVATPVLTSLFGASQVVAQGLSLSLALPGTAVTLLTYALYGHVNWWMGVPLALGGLLSISWGVRLAHALPERLLRVLFCAFLLLCAGLLGLK
ncbi:sulfite exporter TauE/SafE family protein [Zestomonas thermotolerans]|uniref:sulfite exporter TauE/SafE family protein n=1 Tax=Zestomonas thermotolerans TaxID=157784 RepID=UPI0003701F1C|nr:sulfite exporter TauE/SafE family protein [Pseudomonas thermotolerans]